MPFQKTFRTLLETGTVSANAHPKDSGGVNGDSFLSLNGTDATGAMDTDSLILNIDASQSEAKPSWLSEAADGSGDYAKEKVIATWKYVETLIRRDKSIKEIKKIESISRSNKLKLVNK